MQFNYKNKTLNLKARACKECTREAVRNHYEKNKNYYLKKARERNERILKENQTFLLKFLSKNPCVDCGEANPIVLEFDHINIKNKTANVSEMLRLKHSKEKILKEIMKCQVRCANCHRRKTAKDHYWYKHKYAPVA